MEGKNVLTLTEGKKVSRKKSSGGDVEEPIAARKEEMGPALPLSRARSHDRETP